MSIDLSTPWHKASFERFVRERLPQLLAERLPLVGYQVEPTGRHACRMTIVLGAAGGDIQVEYAAVPQPDEEGVFEVDGQHYVVVPTASQEELDVAEIRCVGEQLYAYVAERLGQAPPDLSWDAALARAWLPLDTWIDAFIRTTAHRLEETNWLSRHTHLRRLIVPDRQKVTAPGQAGRTCPFETPEGSNIGRVLTIARGAEIREGRLALVDERPEAGLGPSASMIPFLEHDDPNRLLMGANMLRQWIAQSTPEPAFVQTGNEPHAPGFWAGRNLLTAFVSWGADTVDDGIVISESCARRFDTPYPLQVGDKLSNRHGTKGVVSRILPDDEMPHLADGRPVELIYNFFGMHVRMNFGQVREAVMGRIARAEGARDRAVPAIVPPFHAPGEDELRQRLDRAGLSASGMETLTRGRGGPQLERPSTAGWVYWGRLVHLAGDKIWASVGGPKAQMQGELETAALREVGAYENVRQVLNTRAARRTDAATLAARVAEGPVEQAPPPTPMFSDLASRLQVAGIRATIEDDHRLTFCFAPPQGEVLRLARPLPHPWLRERPLSEIGAYTAADEGEAYALLVEANDRLARTLSSGAPQKLVQDAVAQLESRVNTFFDALLQPAHLRFGERQLFGGRAVIAPGADLHLDQVGLADEIAWTLFGPLVIRELRANGERAPEERVRARDERAAQALDEVMARSWVIVNRAPSLTPTALLAFHPLRDPDQVIRLHPLACDMLNADFDGDQVAVLLPITEAAQREAGQRLSIAAHLARDARLLALLLPPPEALWGLASLNRTEKSGQEIAELAEVEVAAPNGPITQATLAEAMRQVLKGAGTDAALAALEQLTRRGFEVARASGASMSPFLGASLRRPPPPEGDDPALWEAYTEELAEQILSAAEDAHPDLGPQLLAVRIRTRGRHHLPMLIGPRGAVRDIHGRPVIVRHGYVEGLTAGELYACAAEARRGLAQFVARWEEIERQAREQGEGETFTVLARARRARRPGIVFARAAASDEVDPLVDVESRLLVGLPVPA